MAPTHFLLGILLLLAAHQSTAKNESKPEISMTDTGSQSKRQISALPAIEKCRKDREVCLKSCIDIMNCTTACPVCPEIERLAPIVQPAVELVNRNIIIDSVNGTSRQYQLTHPATANHTTIFRLQNFINNTNVVKMPTVINSTNINHINIFNNETDVDEASDDDGPYGLGVDETGPCCIVVQPKTCRYSPSGPRCIHRRHKTCGQQCTSRVIHVQSRHRCHGRSCNRDISYVPQPQPRCFYTQKWPFVSCGGAAQRDCSGCYDHYGSSSHYYEEETSCSRGCYDDGFSYGQLYRRGPVLRPFYYHEPPCYLTGRCSYETGYYSSGYGHYGHESVNPVWGPPAPGVDEVDGRGVFDDDEDTKDGGLNATVSDWGVAIKKCKTVSENGTIAIENCVDSNKENPYAAAPVSPEEFAAQPFVPPPMSMYQPMVPVWPPLIYNPAIDYEYYARSQGGYRAKAGSKTQRNTRKVRRLRRRRLPAEKIEEKSEETPHDS